MTSVGGEGNSSVGSKNEENRASVVVSSGHNKEATRLMKSNTTSINEPNIEISKPPLSVPQGFGLGSGNREGLRLSLENNLSGGVGTGGSLMLTTPTLASTGLSPGSLLLPPTLLTPGTLNLLNTPTSSHVLGLVASSPSLGAPTLTTPTLTPTTLRNIEQMFLEHDELGFSGSHSSESHINAAHFVPPPVAAEDLSKPLKEETHIKIEKTVTSRSSLCSSPDENQKIDAAEVLNSIAQLTPISNSSHSTSMTNSERPSAVLLLPGPSISTGSSKTQVPPPLTVLNPNGIRENIDNPSDLRMKHKTGDQASLDPTLTISSMSSGSYSILAGVAATSDNPGIPLPLIRVPPALPTITISLPSTSQLVKQELPSSMGDGNRTIPPLAPLNYAPSSHVSLPTMPIPQPKDLTKKPTSTSRPTTLNIPRPLTVPTILLPKDPMASTDSSLLSLANVSAVQNHLPVLPPPTRHHIQGVSAINYSPTSTTSFKVAKNVPSSSATITLHKPNNANNCAIIGPTASVVSGLPAGLTITANTNIKQEITNDDINTKDNINTNDSNLNASNYTSKMNINGNQLQGEKANRRKSGKIKSTASQLPPDTRNGSNKNNNVSQKSENGDSEEDDDSMLNNLDLSNLSNEERRKILRRQRNKEAAARCRKRRLDQTLGLQDEVDQWVEQRNELQKEVNELQNQETELQNILNLHQLTNCKLKLANSAASTTTKLIKNSIVTSLEREVVSDMGGGLGRLAAVAAAVSNSMKMAKEAEEGSINLTVVSKDTMKTKSSTSTKKDSL